VDGARSVDADDGRRFNEFIERDDSDIGGFRWRDEDCWVWARLYETILYDEPDDGGFEYSESGRRRR